MQDHDFADLSQEGPFSPRELVLSLGGAVLWVTMAIVLVPLLVQGF